MLDMKFLRENFAEIKERLQCRGEDLGDFDRFGELDARRRELIAEGEVLKSKRNEVSKQVSVLKREKQDADHLIAEMREVGDRIKVLDDELRVVEDDLQLLLLSIPNVPHETVPVGESEDDNVVVRKWGDIRQFAFEAKPHCVSGSAEFNLIGLDPEEYPQLPQISDNHAFQMPIDLLKQMTRQTVFAVSTSETRPVLTGVNWRIEDGELFCVATDSHRLAMRKAPIESGEISTITSVVIPGKSLNELNKILEDTNDLIDIVITDNQILFKTKYLLFFSRLLEGNYPDTSRLIPSDYKTEVVITAKDFLQAIDRASLLAKEGRLFS